ncbi:MAG TPA: ATP-dependent 6-phosphofructokinase, partial [Acidimicrobiales bacterium]|nr:ATP-dependent 6-phosphofructokinase [Acidimicrobiales bacterium]
MRVAMLTGGGDCPGLNAVMRAVVRKGEVVYGDELVGLRDGWRGAIENQVINLSVASFRGTLPRGGTILGSSRTNPYKIDDGPERVKATLADNGIDALVAIGGEDTLGVAARLADEGVAVVGVPKTIDNDLSATELTFGFDTAVQVCVDAIDRLHTTAESHDRVMVVEVMGRHAGHIALWAAIAGGATMVLVPERPFDIDDVCRVIQHRHEGGRWASIVVVAEGAQPAEGTMATTSAELDAFGHVRLGGIGDQLASAIEERTGYETRAIVLGHIQRGGTPTAFDRVLATRFGIAAIDAIH